MLAVIVLSSMLVLAMTMVLAWLVYTVASMRTEVAYISEVNKVIDHINAMAHGVQQAHYRSTTRIERADSRAVAANAKGVELGARLESLAGRVNQHVTSGQAGQSKLDNVEVAMTGVATNTELNTEVIGDHALRLLDLESTMVGKIDDVALDDRLAEYVRVSDMQDPDMSGYARWSDINSANLTTNSLRSGALELVGPNNSGAGTITYTGDGVAIVSGVGSPATKLGPGGLEFGPNAIRVDADGDIAYCKGAACQKLSTAAP